MPKLTFGPLDVKGQKLDLAKSTIFEIIFQLNLRLPRRIISLNLELEAHAVQRESPDFTA